MNATSQDEEYLRHLTVLYVEDDEDAREQFIVFLKRITGVLLTANDGEQGLAAYHEHHPHIIITDIQMPNLDGLSMVREIRKLDKTVCIIVLTAFEQVDYLKASINMGVNKYVTKPVNGLQLHETLLECAHVLLAEEALKNAASTDLLTGLPNRREIANRFNAERSASERHGTPLSLIMVDIDHFKQVNDTFGHGAGDKVLKRVAEAMRSSIRIEDFCGRWGGEEFLLLLPRTAIDSAAVVAEKLRLMVSSLVTEWDGEKISVTISLGVAQFHPDQDMDTCTECADKALYKAKTGGRNRYALAEVCE